MTLYESAAGAVLPWNSIDAGEPLFDALPQQEIEICLTCSFCAASCDQCDGKGNLRAKQGRPKAQIDTEALREMLRLKRCNKEICAALNISKRTLARVKNNLLEV